MYQTSQEGKEHGVFWPFSEKRNTKKGPGSWWEEHQFNFKGTWKVESKVPLRCLKGAAISNLLDPRIWRSKETSGLEMWIRKSLVYNWWRKSCPWSKQRKMEERRRGQGPLVAEWVGFVWLRMGCHRGGRKTCTELRIDTKGNDGLFSRIKHILRHTLNVNNF